MAIVMVAALTACGMPGSGVGETSPQETQIFVADESNNRIVQISNMDGTGWRSLGASGNGVGQFNSPQRVAVDSLGRIYIADTGNNRIVRVNDISGAGWVAFGSSGAGVGQLAYPNTIAVDAQFRIYVLDYNNNRVIRINDMTGAGWVALGAGDCGGVCFGVPNTLTLDLQGRIYIGEGSQVIRLDGMSGSGRTVLETYDGMNPDSLVTPAGLAIDWLGRLYLAGETKLVRFDDMTGAGRVTFLADGSGQGGFSLLMGVTVDANGKIYMVETSHDRISSITDMIGSQWTTLGSYGNGPLQFASPRGIAIY